MLVFKPVPRTPLSTYLRYILVQVWRPSPLSFLSNPTSFSARYVASRLWPCIDFFFWFALLKFPTSHQISDGGGCGCLNLLTWENRWKFSRCYIPPCGPCLEHPLHQPQHPESISPNTVYTIRVYLHVNAMSYLYSDQRSSSTWGTSHSEPVLSMPILVEPTCEPPENHHRYKYISGGFPLMPPTTSRCS